MYNKSVNVIIMLAKFFFTFLVFRCNHKPFKHNKSHTSYIPINIPVESDILLAKSAFLVDLNSINLTNSAPWYYS